ncbi:hypothetical protein [Chryseobacterium luquanense]|uniref:Uncharacterized protein n=1 Tax=Chryseobacterium luquanense TaxID=2983766 RepID=A0ABT3Y4I5_9FLAO|nr:hypothetical protein [Chryseobacterium luquanense]MCX8533068.1 hypothetical protein [Chryseobacterium luquanense]
METKYASFPPFKKELKEHFGYLSFNVTLINLDVIGIRLLGKFKDEVVVIIFRGAAKTGFMYEGSALTEEQVIKVYKDVPECFNDLTSYEEKFAGRLEVLAPQKDNYVFINEMEIVRKIKPI